mgnify:CR=1
ISSRVNNKRKSHYPSRLVAFYKKKQLFSTWKLSYKSAHMSGVGLKSVGWLLDKITHNFSTSRAHPGDLFSGFCRNTFG